MKTKTILLVDDEVNVLNSLSRLLAEDELIRVLTVSNAKQALEIIRIIPDMALIVSDYRMPGMNGIELLTEVHQRFPSITRILLTGAADLQMALDAINKGNIFRCLIKPCAPEACQTAIQDGLRQHELFTAERELLSKTLSGGVKLMIDLLSVLSPDIFAQALRLRTYAIVIADALQLEDQAWEIELAAMVSQIGAVTIHPQLLESWKQAEMLEENDLAMIRSIPIMGKQLISNIPRLENIAEAVGYQNCFYGGPATANTPAAENIPLIARILKIILDFDSLFEHSHNPEIAFLALETREFEYDPELLAVFRTRILRDYNQATFKLSSHTTPNEDTDYDPEIWAEYRIKVSRNYDQFPGRAVYRSSYQLSGELVGEKKITVEAIKPGMVLSRNVNDRNNALIVSKGTMITEVLMYRLINYFHSKELTESVFIEFAS